MGAAVEPRDAIRARALEFGFDCVGFTDPDGIGEAGARLDEFIERGWQGDMGWMAEKADRRRHPRSLWPEVRSIVMLGVNYGPVRDPLKIHRHPDRAAVSVYAQNKDYHDLVKKRLKRLGRWMAEEYGAGIKVFVDTAPVMEKPLAQAAGLGWQGKHTNLLSRDFGSWLFLGAVFTTLDIAPVEGEQSHCGSCTACLDACPTGAFPAPYRLDARRCISYLTIEHKGHIAAEFRAAMGNRIYGCDDCLGVCPWNKFARATREEAFHPRIELTAPKLAELASLDDAAFRQMFSGSPIKRVGRDRFIRNVLIGLGNSGDVSMAAVARAHIADPSPLVRAMAVWALSRLLPREEFHRVRADHFDTETDGAVRDEWQAV